MSYDICHRYYDAFAGLKAQSIVLPTILAYVTNSGHIFYLITRGLDERTALIDSLRQCWILSVFYYLSLHKSPFYTDKHDGRQLPWANHHTN
jgi:dTDP-4-amino-4,6-dideoxygalactose transaminase